MKIWRWLLAIALGMLAAFAGLHVALYIVGPLTRALFGVPFGFNADYGTREAVTQATAVQLVSVGLVFFVAGLGYGILNCSRPIARSLWVANPLSVGFGYLAYARLDSTGSPAEYFGHLGFVLLALAAPVILAPTMALGIRLGGRLRKRGSPIQVPDHH